MENQTTILWIEKTDQHWETDIKALLEWLELLKIIEEKASDKTRMTETEITNKMSTALVVNNIIEQTVISKSIIPNLG